MFSETLIRKAAIDSGFDLEFGTVDGWQAFGVSGSPVRVWIREVADGLLLALSSAAVMDEMPKWPREDEGIPAGAAGAIHCEAYDAAFAALNRARVLDATLPNRLHERWVTRVAALSKTETEVLAKQRIGQDVFRQGLMDYWESRCAVTGLDVPELLRASHCKPWKDATDEERLDVHNGLLLAVHLDALFDKGFLTFDDDGRCVVSPLLSNQAIENLGLSGRQLRLQHCHTVTARYLGYHRERVFRSG